MCITPFISRHIVVLQVIDPLRSRCLCIRVAAPTLPQIEQVLDHVAGQEGVQLPEQLRSNIAQVRSALHPHSMFLVIHAGQQQLELPCSSAHDTYIWPCQLKCMCVLCCRSQSGT